MPTGKHLLFSAFALIFLNGAGRAQPAMTCMPSAVTPVVRSEGLTERLGDIVIPCSGGTAGMVITGNLTVFLAVNVTNRVTSAGATDAVLTIDTGSGPMASGVPGVLLSQSAVVFNGVSFTVPASRNVVLRVMNLRGNATQAGPAENSPIQAFLAMNGPSAGLAVDGSQLTIAATATGLLASYSSSGVRCTGSPLPSTITFPNLIATGTRFFSARLTEGFAAAFQKKNSFSDTGTRFVIRYSGFPANTQLFVPDLVAGSDAAQPTAGGDLGLPTAPGQYTQGSGTLLLARVLGADAHGAGGTPIFTPSAPGSGTLVLNSVSAVPLSSGNGVAVYEVVDSNPAVQESAQIPTFIGLPAFPDGTSVVASQSISLGPISAVGIASSSDPVPRFVGVAPPSDCATLQDCNASYFPRLSVVISQSLQFTAPAGSAPQYKYVQAQNQGGGILSWTASVSYKTGSGWITLDTPSGVNGGTIRIDVHPEKLSPGTYDAALTIDAGPLAGSQSIPIQLTVTAPAPPKPTITITSVTNAAAPEVSTVVPGSLATVWGAGLSGRNVAVTFSGVPARLLYTADDQINLEIPHFASRALSTQAVVTVDGQQSAAFTVSMALAAPAIFANGIANQDGSTNGPENPAPVGSVLQIYLTGLATDSAMVKIHDRDGLAPLYAGPAPTLIGVQQINVAIPDDLPAMTTEVNVCAFAWPDATDRTCSPPAKVVLGQ